MNRLAVALAADSAVTVSRVQQNKVYNGANKVFMLSRRHPVGIMVYNNGSLMGVPWESLIKAFRDELGDQEFGQLEEYADAFLDYIESRTALFDEKAQKRYFLSMVRAEFEEIARRIRKRVHAEDRKAIANTDREAAIKQIVVDIIGKTHDDWMALERSEYVSAGTGADLASQCSPEISQLTADIFQIDGWVAQEAEVRQLRELAMAFVDKDRIAPAAHSGVVVAGFGRDDFFPVLRSIDVGEIYADQLKLANDDVVHVDDDETQSYVGVFADSDMANVFISGVSNDMERQILSSAYNMAENLTDAVAKALHADENTLSQLAVVRDDLMSDLVEDIEASKAERREFNDALVHLPKDELASVAASLVNLNSFKKRMSLSLETVGGPVDVAVISKGDGFVWIDRKHYFKAELNPHFVGNKFGSAANVGAINDRKE